MGRITLSRWNRMSRSTLHYIAGLTTPAKRNLRTRETRRRRARMIVENVLGINPRHRS